jgi:hypothetical protein
MKREIFTILGYAALVVVVLLMSQCESRVTLTTPKKDAQHIIALAQGVESEEELKSVEKLARKYEIAYERMYNGAKALEFKRLTNDALREASYVCDQIHADNERLCELQATFSGSLADLDGAWSRNTASKEADMANKLKTVLSVLAVLLVFALVLSLATALLQPKYMTDLVEGSMLSQYYGEAGGHDVIFIGDCEVYANFTPMELYREKGITSYVRGSSQNFFWPPYLENDDEAQKMLLELVRIYKAFEVEDREKYYLHHAVRPPLRRIVE